MLQLILHLIGDYILQSDWMATNKTSQNFACFCHALVYTLPFLLLTRSVLALLVIGGTHFLIDRFRLAKYVCYAKNLVLAPNSEIFEADESKIHPFAIDDYKEKYKWENCQPTGYNKDLPPFMSVWLMIITDNTLHLAINYFSIEYL